MRNFGAKAHIALGQAFLLTTLLFAAMFLGLVPDRDGAVLEGRAALAETLAANGSAVLTQADARRLEAVLGLVVERNPELLSAAVRRDDVGPYLPEPAQGLVDAEGALRCLPHRHGCDGFFAVRLVRA